MGPGSRMGSIHGALLDSFISIDTVRSAASSKRCSTGVVLTTMLLFSARSRLHHGIVFSNYFNDLLRYIKDFFASKMVFKEKQKTKQAARNMARSSTKKKVQ
ncbi:hypothetical protein Y032_0318g2356 [Ancylostoma ceylanicum]|uniref:Uncharacterized protein n=1 Tax=Ancylostoma ceylanicum TaxID=53326 RepID=A0A016S121_9BILA|nr:hypothetical protein Y032_0318g2356 [Ancylostoma ceylanicum]